MKLLIRRGILGRLHPDDRPRERLLRFGARALTDQELLAILIGKGTKEKGVMELADEILRLVDRHNGPPPLRELMKLRGVALAKGSILAASFELSRRKIYPDKQKILNPADTYSLLSDYATRKQEHFICISLNGASEIIRQRVVSIGLVDRAPVHPREVFADPITDRASRIIVAHNHPSGSLDPSPEDIEVTTRLYEAGEILGIRLVDHLIFTKKGYYSFNEAGRIVRP